MKIVNKKIEDLKPYENNPRFNDDAVKYVANSIKEFGFKVPMVIDKDNVIVAGHTRYKAAMELGMTEVPCIVADDLTPEQIKAFRLADNKVGEMSTWNIDLLTEELEEIKDIEMEELGFTSLASLEPVEEDDDVEVDYDGYSTKVGAPQYEITGEQPDILELVDTSKAEELIEKINKANITDEQKIFLVQAAQRHLVFNYSKIAEYYAHQNREMQELMEDSALVIIDIDDAIAKGYVRLEKTIENIMNETGISTEDDEE